MTPDKYNRPWQVYRVRDRDMSLLYVGATVNLQARLHYHATNAYWWSDDLQIEVSEHPNQRTALDAEAAEIVALRPRFNVKGRRPRPEWSACDHVETLMAFRAGDTNSRDALSKWERRRRAFAASFPEIAALVLPAIPLPRDLTGEIFAHAP